ncbi:MAG: hypothetical protein P1U46_04725 [Patescibacteria group bacterium]|nr:hypothetical protein [Patescibacteria group bacterium]
MLSLSKLCINKLFICTVAFNENGYSVFHNSGDIILRDSLSTSISSSTSSSIFSFILFFILFISNSLLYIYVVIFILHHISKDSSSDHTFTFSTQFKAKLV